MKVYFVINNPSCNGIAEKTYSTHYEVSVLAPFLTIFSFKLYDVNIDASYMHTCTLYDKHGASAVRPN